MEAIEITPGLWKVVIKGIEMYQFRASGRGMALDYLRIYADGFPKCQLIVSPLPEEKQ